MEGLTDPRAVKGGILGTKEARQLPKDKLDSISYCISSI